MRIGAYQFAVSGRMKENRNHILDAVARAAEAGVELLIFPECAVTGYPPMAISSPAEIDESLKNDIHARVQEAAVRNRMHIILGTIVRKENAFWNAALVFAPDGTVTEYGKRALWGWDRDNFVPGSQDGIIQAGPFRIGIRICFEVRFPEYFRELYRQGTDLNVILFYDVADGDGAERYDLIRGHIRTRAVENVCYTLSVNTIHPFQSAPTMLADRSGRVLCEAERNKEELLLFDFLPEPLDFGERGRKETSDSIV